MLILYFLIVPHNKEIVKKLENATYRNKYQETLSLNENNDKTNDSDLTLIKKTHEDYMGLCREEKVNNLFHLFIQYYFFTSKTTTLTGFFRTFKFD